MSDRLMQKNSRKSVLFLFSILVILISGAISPIAEGFDTPVERNYSPTEIDYPGTNVVFHIGEAYPQFKSDLGIIMNQGGVGNTIWCRSMEDSDCSFGPRTAAYSSLLLPPCADSLSTNCIVGLQITSSDGQIQKAKLVKELGGYSIPANQAKGYIGGRSASVWTVDDTEAKISDTSKSKYLIAAQLMSRWDGAREGFDTEKISVSVFPFAERTGDFFADRWATDSERSNYANTQFQGIPLQFIPKIRQGMSGSDLRDCLFFDDKYCGLHTKFIDGTRVKVVLRLTNEIGGWFHGRIKDPLISVEALSPTINLITVDAESILIPRLTHVVANNSLDETEKKLFDQTYWGGSAPRESYAGPLADTGETAFNFLSLLREKVGDSSAEATSTWNFSSIKAGIGSHCLNQRGEVLGIVSTNATAFESTAPKFTDGQLEYKVSGLHYKSDKKTENLGTYDLVISSATARCLYGFTNAPISATVSIAGGSDSKIATTIVNEKNGWLKLAAYGFTFSEKTLQVKLSQDAPSPAPSASATPLQSPSIAAVTVKKTSITCVKGKTSKKVTAVNPKCPTGYKKK